MEIQHLIHAVGSPRTRREKSTGEGSHEGNVKGDRAKLRSPISFPISSHIAPIVSHHLPLTTRLSLPGAALESLASHSEEPVGLAVIRSLLSGQCGKARTGLAFLFEPGHFDVPQGAQS